MLLALQEWNNWVNNLDTALAYTAAIFGMELPKIANDLWPRPQDDITPLKKVIGWVNGIINGFPVTALMGRYVGSLGAIIQGNDIIMSSNMVAPGTDTQYLHWSDFADQMSQVLNNYRQAISSYVTKIIDAPIDDPTWGINKILQGGRFLERGTNFTQNSLEDWMIRSVRFNALGLLLQAQDIYLLRTWNVTRERCDDRHDGLHCTPQPNGLWTRYRLQQRGGAAYDPDPANDVAHKLMHNYDMTKEDIFEGPTRCFDQNDYELLTDPWSAGDLDLSFFADPLKPCNFNVRVCNMDAAEHGEYGKTEWSNPSLGEGFTHWDDRCKDQGTWDY